MDALLKHLLAYTIQRGQIEKDDKRFVGTLEV